MKMIAKIFTKHDKTYKYVKSGAELEIKRQLQRDLSESWIWCNSLVREDWDGCTTLIPTKDIICVTVSIENDRD